MPALWFAPAVGAAIVKHDQILRVAKISNVRAAIAIQVRHEQARDAFVGWKRINAETRTRRQLVQIQFSRGNGIGAIRFARQVVEQVDFGMQIVRHDKVVQTVAIEVGNVQLVDHRVNRENLVAAKTKRVGDGRRRRRKTKNK